MKLIPDLFYYTTQHFYLTDNYHVDLRLHQIIFFADFKALSQKNYYLSSLKHSLHPATMSTINSSILGLAFLVICAAYALTILACIVVVLRENRNPIRSLAWVTALIFLPGVGLIFYLFFGRSLKNMRMISRHKKRKLMRATATRNVNLKEIDIADERRQLIMLTHNIAKAKFTINNHLRIFTEGREKFEALKEDLKKARRTILLQYYIFADDRLGNEIADILIEKARQGVKVFVIYDHVGSFSTRSRFFGRMRDAGVDIHPFFRVTFPQLANRLNWRNHRKLAIIDREIGYIGGMNIADRYIHGTPDNHVWRDTHFRITGDIVESMILSFAIDWSFMGQQIPNTGDINVPAPKVKSSLTGMQFVATGPVDAWDNLSLCFLKAISTARKSIYLQTPYFLPTDALLQALEAAALSKVDVRIMIPERCDSRLLRLASFSYITQCLKAGIKVYLYKPGMLHAKSMVIDDDLVLAGSTNFDFRSLENNFESTLFIYDKDVNEKMRAIFLDDINDSIKLTFSRWRTRPLLQRLLESIVRLLSPIL